MATTLQNQIRDAVAELGYLEMQNKQKKQELAILQQEITVSEKNKARLHQKQEMTFNELATTQTQLETASLHFGKLVADLQQEVQHLAHADEELQKLRGATVEQNQEILNKKQEIEVLCNEKAEVAKEIKQLMVQKQELLEERNRLANHVIQLTTAQENLEYQSKIALSKIQCLQ